MEEGPFRVGRSPDFGRGNPPVVAPDVGHQEGRRGDENPTRGRWFPSKLTPFETVLTGDRQLRLS
ncbi:hypothetical protein [Prochlorothrix hollandica]|uniref:hypothetical protein n=1 Tax=Prochlorothrix hollandica TaxID=1223 RepID=UPI00333EB252